MIAIIQLLTLLSPLARAALTNAPGLAGRERLRAPLNLDGCGVAILNYLQ